MCVWVCGQLCASGCVGSSVCSASPARMDKAEGGDGCGNENVRPTESAFLKIFLQHWFKPSPVHSAAACVCACCLFLNLHFRALSILQMFWSPAAVAAGIQPGQGDPAARNCHSQAPLPFSSAASFSFPQVDPGTPAARIPFHRRS